MELTFLSSTPAIPEEDVILEEEEEDAILEEEEEDAASYTKADHLSRFVI